MESEQIFSFDAANNDDTDDHETRHNETGSIDGSGNEKVASNQVILNTIPNPYPTPR